MEIHGHQSGPPGMQEAGDLLYRLRIKLTSPAGGSGGALQVEHEEAGPRLRLHDYESGPYARAGAGARRQSDHGCNERDDVRAVEGRAFAGQLAEGQMYDGLP